MRKDMIRTSLAASGFLLAALSAQAQQAGPTLTVTVAGAEPNSGQIIISLFDSPDTYMKEAVATRTLPVGEAGASTFVFEGLAVGEYAATVIYDEDSDGELDTGFLGIPKEKIGFSNNARGRMGPAPFEKAKFAFGEAGAWIGVNLEQVR
ncbi:MAG: DUF2141 domain-containing protein [Alphaproteobacteria bacterium]